MRLKICDRAGKRADKCQRTANPPGAASKYVEINLKPVHPDKV
jgi:hypothetical protein